MEAEAAPPPAPQRPPPRRPPSAPPGHAARLSDPHAPPPAAGAGPMELGPGSICGEVTVLHGGFLLAATLSHPKPLSELAKADWPKVGKPITDALREICASCSSSYPPQPDAWQKVAAAVLWSKILSSRAASPSSEERWRGDAFFSASSAIPEINHTVLFELLKALDAPRLFVQLLLVLPERVRQRELETLTEYLAEETAPADVSFFLDVWWEILKHREGREDRLTLAFRATSHQHLSEPDDDAGRPPKRFKSEAASPGAAGLLPVLMAGLEQIKGNVGPAKAKAYALANVVDGLSALVASESEPAPLPIEAYLEKLSWVVALWGADSESRYREAGLEEKVKEAERSVSLRGVAKLPDGWVPADLACLHALLEEWSAELQGFLCDPQQACLEAHRLLDGLGSLAKGLASRARAGGLEEDAAWAVSELSQSIKGFLEKVGPRARGGPPDAKLTAGVAVVVIDERLERHAEVCSVFASEKSWASATEWAACLARNKELFRDPELLLRLLESAAALGGSALGREQQHQVAKVLLEGYAELSLPGKNRVLSGVLAAWGGQGLSGALQVFSEEFQEELNVAFNQIIQGSSGEGSKKAVAAVARLAALNPEATVKKVCALAVSNLGTHHFLAEILRSFPALSCRDPQEPDAPLGLVLRCLKEAAWERLSSATEKEQFLEFLGCLLQPSGAGPLLSPAEVTRSLVLPSLRSDSPRLELALRVLDAALKVPSGQSWVHACHPFPLLLGLCRLLDRFTQFWHEPRDGQSPSLETKDLAAAILAQLCDAVMAQKDAISPELWAQSVAWLHRRAGALDWTVGLRLKGIYGEHFKNEAPATLFQVCKLPEDGWASRPVPAYGPGSGLLAWLECCCVSAAFSEEMLALLVVNVDDPEEVNLFSKGFLVAFVQVFPWCSPCEWGRLCHVVQSLLGRELLYVPYSLEYVSFLPLLNFRPFARPLQASVLFLRAFQLLCHSNSSTWLSDESWRHVARLYCLGLSDLLGSVKSAAQRQCRSAEEGNSTRELCFAYVQLFCHVLHVAAMLPEDGATAEPLLLLALEVLSQYEVLYDADESLGSSLRKANEKHFLESVAGTVADKELRALLLHKLGKL